MGSIQKYLNVCTLLSMSDQFSFRWSEFDLQRNIELKEIRDNRELFDVTLACDDEQIGAHKLILGAGSKFFQKVLRNLHSNNPFLYIRGCKSRDMNSILDFMYFGETTVEQGDIQQFVNLAQDLQIKGFDVSDVVEIEESIAEAEKHNNKQLEIDNTSEEENQNVVASKPSACNNVMKDQDPIDVGEVNFVNVVGNEVIDISNDNEAKVENTQNVLFRESPNSTGNKTPSSGSSSIVVELEQKRDKLVEKLGENQYQCKKCEKVFTRRDDTKRHTDLHFPEYSYPCKYCGKMFVTRANLRAHIRYHKRNNEKPMLSYLPEVIFTQE